MHILTIHHQDGYQNKIATLHIHSSFLHAFTHMHTHIKRFFLRWETKRCLWKQSKNSSMKKKHYLMCSTSKYVSQLFISCHHITTLTLEDIKCETPLRCDSECENTFTVLVTYRLSASFTSLKCYSCNRVQSELWYKANKSEMADG